MIFLNRHTGVSAAQAPEEPQVSAELEVLAGTAEVAPAAVRGRHTEARAGRAAAAAGAVQAAGVVGALHTAAPAAAAEGALHAAVQAAAWVLRKEAPNAVPRAEIEVRRMRAGAVAAAGAHIEASRHPARIG